MNKPFRTWQLQVAKARLSEVVKLAQSEGPQIVTLHGKAVVTITKYLDGGAIEDQSGAAFVQALREGAKGLPDIDPPEWDTPGAFRDVNL